jgi:hypothetical protein
MRLGMGRTKTPLQLVSILFRGEIVWSLALAIRSQLTAKLSKEYSYNSTAFLGNYGFFYFKLHLFPARRFRSRYLQYIMLKTGAFVTAVLTVDVSDWTVNP